MASICPSPKIFSKSAEPKVHGRCASTPIRNRAPLGSICLSLLPQNHTCLLTASLATPIFTWEGTYLKASCSREPRTPQKALTAEFSLSADTKSHGNHRLFTLRRHDALKKANITHVVSALRMPLDRDLFKKFKHYVVDIDDVEDENIIQYFAASNEFITEGLKEGGGVLVHW